MSKYWEKIRTGSKVKEKYKLVRKLGPGGGGPVFSAMELERRKVFQVRFFSDEDIPDEPELTRRMDEARRAQERCGDIVTLPLEYGFHNGIPYVVHDFVKARTLEQVFDMGRRPSPNDIEYIIESLLKMLVEIHEEGIVHLGLSPVSIYQRGGVLLTFDPAVLDFCLAPRSGHSYYTYPATVDPKLLPLAGYAAPEQALSGEKVNYRADLYSTGAIICRIFLGSVPYQGGSTEEILDKIKSGMPHGLIEAGSEIPAAMRKFLLRALQRDPGERFQSASEMLKAFYPSIGAKGPAAAPPPVPISRRSGALDDESTEELSVGSIEVQEMGRDVEDEAQPPTPPIATPPAVEGEKAGQAAAASQVKPDYTGAAGKKEAPASPTDVKEEVDVDVFAVEESARPSETGADAGQEAVLPGGEKGTESEGSQEAGGPLPETEESPEKKDEPEKQAAVDGDEPGPPGAGAEAGAILEKKPSAVKTVPPVVKKPVVVAAAAIPAKIEKDKKKKRGGRVWTWVAIIVIFVGLVSAVLYFTLFKDGFKDGKKPFFETSGTVHRPPEPGAAGEPEEEGTAEAAGEETAREGVSGEAPEAGEEAAVGGEEPAGEEKAAAAVENKRPEKKAAGTKKKKTSAEKKPGSRKEKKKKKKKKKASSVLDFVD